VAVIVRCGGALPVWLSRCDVTLSIARLAEKISPCAGSTAIPKDESPVRDPNVLEGNVPEDFSALKTSTWFKDESVTQRSRNGWALAGADGTLTPAAPTELTVYA
jgi:hypothetical protein